MKTILEIILFLAAAFFAVRSFYLLVIADYIKVGSCTSGEDVKISGAIASGKHLPLGSAQESASHT